VHEWLVGQQAASPEPIEWEPDTVVAPADMQRTVDGRLRPAAADALTALVAAAQNEGVGAIGLNSAFRSFDSQTRTYNGYVNSLGREAADLQSARPGFSEHQTGLATDVAAATAAAGRSTVRRHGAGRLGRGERVAVRLHRALRRRSDRHHRVQAEPWHLRYIGPELAQVYRRRLPHPRGLLRPSGRARLRRLTRRDRVPQRMKPSTMNSGT
jgi:D-alanyl-D-alanine carboxypeptidase